MDISDNIAKINDKIKSAAAQAGRSLEEIKLIAVSKKKSTDLIVAAHNNAKAKLKSKTTEEISKAAGGFGIPGFKWPL